MMLVADVGLMVRTAGPTVFPGQETVEFALRSTLRLPP